LYDKEVFKFVGADRGTFLESGGGSAPLFLSNDRDGRVSVANVMLNFEDKDANVAGEGLVARLTFRWIGSENKAVSLDNIAVLDFNGGLNSLEGSTLESPVPLPDKFALSGNYPNPFNPETNIAFELPKTERVRIDIYNILGQKVRTLVDREFKAGIRTIKWDATNDFGSKVASGMYIYRVVAGSNVASKKMMVIK
ncbi:T9SS type A sorting domain-containing protein, partial [candidate division KSB1 bacterium]